MSSEFAEGKFAPVMGVPQIVRKVENFVSVLELPAWAVELQNSSLLPEAIVIAAPLSYCAGVVRANQAADELLAKHPNQRVYFYHAPIHNDTKLAEWEAKGAVVVGSLDDVQDHSIVLFSAHGVSPQIWLEAKAKHLKGKDATCPLVDKTHREVKELREQGYTILLVGHCDHDEIVGTFGEAPDNIIVVNPHMKREELNTALESLKDKPIAVRNQTTLAVSDLLDLISYIKKIRPDVNLAKKSDICYATENRQKAILETIASSEVDLMIIFGSGPNTRQPSSNSIRLREIVESLDVDVASHLVEDISEIQAKWFDGVKTVGISAGASADPKRMAEFLAVARSIGLRNNQIVRIEVDEELQVFAPACDFDFSKD